MSAAGEDCQKIYPVLSGRVVDEADLISVDDETKLIDMLAALEAETKHQMVVATVRSLQGKAIEDYSRCLGNHWEIGRSGVDDGVMMLVAPNERRVRVEVGDGLTAKLTNDEARAIIENEIVPAFRQSRWAAGIMNGTSAIIREVR